MSEAELERKKEEVLRLAKKLAVEVEALKSLAARCGKPLAGLKVERVVEVAATSLWYDGPPDLEVKIDPRDPREPFCVVKADGKSVGRLHWCMDAQRRRAWHRDKSSSLSKANHINLTDGERQDKDLAMKAVWREYVRYWKSQGKGRL